MDIDRKKTATSSSSSFQPDRPLGDIGKPENEGQGQRPPRRRVRPWFVVAFFALVCFSWGVQNAAAASEPASPTDPFSTLQKRLVHDGYNAADLAALYGRPEARFDHQGITGYFLHRESTLDYGQFLSKASIAKAQDYTRRYKKTFDAARKRYGVEAEIVTAILLVESRLGRYGGKHLVLNTLSNLAVLGDDVTRDMVWQTYVKEKAANTKEDFDKWADRKSRWAYGELKAFLTFVDTQKVDPFSVKGSYAGALGYAQFIPSSVLKYGKDGNEDGKIDLYDHPDAIESVSNYLKQHGWKPGLKREKALNILLRYNNSTYYANTILDVADRITKQTRS